MCKEVMLWSVLESPTQKVKPLGEGEYMNIRPAETSQEEI